MCKPFIFLAGGGGFNVDKLVVTLVLEEFIIMFLNVLDRMKTHLFVVTVSCVGIMWFLVGFGR